MDEEDLFVFAEALRMEMEDDDEDDDIFSKGSKKKKTPAKKRARVEAYLPPIPVELKEGVTFVILWDMILSGS